MGEVGMGVISYAQNVFLGWWKSLKLERGGGCTLLWMD